MTTSSIDLRKSRFKIIPPWLSLGTEGVVFFVVLAASYLPLLFRLSSWLWNRDHYSFFPWAMLAVVALLAPSLALPGDRRSSKWLRSLLFRSSLLLIIGATILVSPWLAGVSAMCVLIATIYAIGGSDVTTRALPAWLLLWMLIPVPLSLDRDIILRMQHFATKLSSGILDLAGYRHVVDGVVLRLPGNVYHVEEACSGIQSLFSCLFCTGLILILNRAGILRAALLLVAAVFWVLIANIARISSVVILKESFGLPVDDGFYHSLLGFVFFAITLAAVFSTERLMCWLWPTLDSPFWEYRTKQERSKHGWKQKPLTDFFDPWEFRLLVGGFGLVGLVQITSIIVGGSMAPASVGDITLLSERDANGLPEQLNGWTQEGYRYIERDSNDINGAVSRLWILKKDGMTVEASLDGPYTNGWHYLSDCYRGQGWSDSAEQYHSYRFIGEDRGGDFLTFDVQKANEEYGMVVTALFDGDFRAFVAPQVKKMQRHYGRLNDFKERAASLFNLGDNTVARSDALSFQIQVFYHTTKPLTQHERDACLSLFHDLRHHFTDDKS